MVVTTSEMADAPSQIGGESGLVAEAEVFLLDGLLDVGARLRHEPVKHTQRVASAPRGGAHDLLVGVGR